MTLLIAVNALPIAKNTRLFFHLNFISVQYMNQKSSEPVFINVKK